MTDSKYTFELNSILKNVYNDAVANGIVLNKYTEQMNYFASKKQLPKDEYLVQLEKNVVYNKNLYLYTLGYFLSYLYDAQPSDDIEHTYHSILYQAQQRASQVTHMELDYLLYNQNVDVPNDIKHLHELKQSKKFIELFDELEFQIQYYKSHYEMLCYFISKIISSKQVMSLIKSHFSDVDFENLFRKELRTYIDYLMMNCRVL